MFAHSLRSKLSNAGKSDELILWFGQTGGRVSFHYALPVLVGCKCVVLTPCSFRFGAIFAGNQSLQPCSLSNSAGSEFHVRNAMRMAFGCIDVWTLPRNLIPAEMQHSRS
ncbi:unnamed protein product [Periconia digitata]|uniref:Uncharacterized protein n=1 Tax=Periconia digitata TaxID=1303443 RepID=A0A9W4XY83_9PLEO|nr:unnamed protein product [Periconia digitata]